MGEGGISTEDVHESRDSQNVPVFPTVLTAGGDSSAIDAATRRVRDERWPEVEAVQKMQEKQGSVFFNDRWSTQLVFRLLPWLMRTGILQWLRRKESRLMSDGVVPVRLVV
jgi:hypothetical protein